MCEIKCLIFNNQTQEESAAVERRKTTGFPFSTVTEGQKFFFSFCFFDFYVYIEIIIIKWTMRRRLNLYFVYENYKIVFIQKKNCERLHTFRDYFVYRYAYWLLTSMGKDEKIKLKFFLHLLVILFFFYLHFIMFSY